MGHSEGFAGTVLGQAAASDFPSTHEMQTAVVIVGSIGAAAFLIGAILLMRWACWRGSHQGRARDPPRESFVIPASGESPFLFGNARAGVRPLSRQSDSSEGSCELKEKGSMMIPIVVVSPDDSVSVAVSFQSSVKSELPAVELSAVKLDLEACSDGAASVDMERSQSGESSTSSSNSAGLAPMTPQPSTEHPPSLAAGPNGSSGSASANVSGVAAGSSQSDTVGGAHTARGASQPAGAAVEAGEVGSSQDEGEPQLPIGFILHPLAPAAPATSSQAGPHPQPAPFGRAAPAATAVTVGVPPPRRRPALIPEDIHPAVRYEEEDRRRRLARADPLTHRHGMAGFALGMMLPCMLF